MNDETYADSLLGVEGRLMDMAPEGGEDEALDRVLGRVRAHATAHPLRGAGRPWFRTSWGGPVVVAVPLAAAAALLAAITLGHPQKARHVSPAASPPPSAVPLVLASPSPAVIDNLSNLHMVDADHGWAYEDVYAESNPGGHYVVTTADGGHHWQLTSLASQPTSTTLLANSSALAAVDARTAWVVAGGGSIPASSSPSPSMVHLWRTTDGGRTWRHSTPFSTTAAFGNDALTVSGNNGWLVMEAPVPLTGLGTAPRPLELWRTTDGGATWSKAPALPISTDLSGIPGDFGFSDANTWFAASAGASVARAPQAGAAAGVFVTHDAGRSWHRMSLPAPPGYDAAVRAIQPDDMGIQDIRFSSPTDGTLVFAMGLTTGANCLQYAALYRTHDGGATWTARALPALPYPGMSDWHLYPSLHFIGCGQNGDNNAAIPRSSGDGGITWRSGGDLGFRLDGMAFSDASHGIALEAGRGVASQIAVTADGGFTWTAFDPALPAAPLPPIPG